MTTFIVFAEDWQRHPSSSQHLVKQLLTRHQVVWVNSIGLRSPKLNKTDLTRLWQKAKALAQPRPTVASLEQPLKPYKVVNPWCLPFHQWAWVRKLNRWLLKWQLTPVLAQLPASDRVLWLALPSAVCVVGALAEQQVLYYCGDDFSSLAGVDHQTMEALEQQLIAQVDLIVCASPRLALKFPARDVQLLNHGVDLDLFSGMYPRPEVLTNKPLIAGFYGLLADWLDVQLIDQIAQRCPEWTFVLIGRQAVDVSCLKARANVMLVAEVPHQDLVQFACHFQALLLPFKRCQQIDYCNPLKLREYLALGHPIISVPFPAAEPFAEKVLFAQSTEEWVDHLRRIATWSDAERTVWQKACRAMIQYESWQAKSKSVEQWLQLEDKA